MQYRVQMSADNDLKSGEPVVAGAVFATLLNEMLSATQELEARRRFDDQVSKFLQAKGLLDDFEEWRKTEDGAAKGAA